MESNNIRLAIVVVSTGRAPYLEMEDAQQKTWISDAGQTPVIYFEGNASLTNSLRARALAAIMKQLQQLNYRESREIGLSSIVQSSKVPRWIRRLLQRGWLTLGIDRLRIGWGAVLNWESLHGNFLSRLLGTVFRFVFSDKILISPGRARCSFPAHWFLLSPIYLIKYRFAMEYLNVDFVLFTTGTCYVRVEALKEKLRRLPREAFYGGHVMYRSGVPFVAGNSLIMSPDLISKILKNRRHYRYDLPDDVSLGLLINRLSLAKAHHIATEELPFGASIPDDFSAQWKDRPIIRCKTAQVTHSGPDVAKQMWRVHRFVSEN